jgi:HlyD family secretion protein
MRSHSLWAAVAFLVVATAVYVYWTESGEAAERRYVTLPLERGDVTATVIATGTLNPVTMVQVGTYVSGAIEAIYADYNSPVTKGQLVAKIDPRPFQVKVRQAEANLATAEARVQKDRADLELKRLTLDRNKELLGKRLVSQNDVDTALSNYVQAEAQLAVDAAAVKQSEAALEEARVNLAYTDITSPVDGVIVSRDVDVGQTVAASFQTPTLFQIAQDLTQMQVNTNVSESDIGAVAAGQRATFMVDAYPERTFDGVVAQVRNAPIILQNVVTYDVVVAVPNPDHALKPGMTATVTVITEERDDVVRIPLRALRFTPEEAATEGDGNQDPAVWVIRDGNELERVPVRLGARGDQHGELLSDSLEPGDSVAVAYSSGTRPTAEPPPSFLGGRR